MAASRQDVTRRPALFLLAVLLVLGTLVDFGQRKYLFLGLATGAAYALIAVGYTMVYGIIELINFAHGEVYMFGAYLALTFARSGPAEFSDPGKVERGILWLSGLFAVAAGLTMHDALRRRPGLAASARTGLAALAGLGFGGITFWLSHRAVPPPVACLAAIAWAAVLGVAMEQVAYRPLRRAPRLAALITALGLSLILQNLAQWMWGATYQPVSASLVPDLLEVRPPAPGLPPGLFTSGEIELLGVRITSMQVFMVFVTGLLMVGLTLLITRTRLGRAMRACAQDRDAAYLMGVDVDRVISWTFAIGSALGAAAGILVALYEAKVFPQMGVKAGVVAFAAAVLGGIGNIPGAVLGGLVIGIAQAMAVFFELSQWDIGVSYLVMIAIILLQPEGLLGAQRPRKS